MGDSPEERRDSAIASIIAEGGVVMYTEPLATKDDPHTIAAYRIAAGAPDIEVAARLSALRVASQLPETEFVPYEPLEEDFSSEV